MRGCDHDIQLLLNMGRFPIHLMIPKDTSIFAPPGLIFSPRINQSLAEGAIGPRALRAPGTNGLRQGVCLGRKATPGIWGSGPTFCVRRALSDPEGPLRGPWRGQASHARVTAGIRTPDPLSKPEGPFRPKRFPSVLEGAASGHFRPEGPSHSRRSREHGVSCSPRHGYT